MAVNQKLNLIIHAEAGPGVGTRTVVQMIELAKAWKRLSGNAAFACTDLPARLTRRIAYEGFKLFTTDKPVSRSTDNQRLFEIINLYHPNWIVLAGKKHEEQSLQRFRQTSSRLMIVSDHFQKDYQLADLVLAPDHPESQKARFSNQTQYLTGERYSLDAKPTLRHFPAKARRIFVWPSVVANQDQWTISVLQTLSDLNQQRLVVDCLIDFDFQQIEWLTELKKTANLNLRIHRRHDRINQLGQQVDLAITGDRAAFVQLSGAGIPTISIDFQSDRKKIKSSIRRSINSRELRQQLAERSLQMNDGRGPQRIAQAMIAVQNARFSGYDNYNIRNSA